MTTLGVFCHPGLRSGIQELKELAKGHQIKMKLIFRPKKYTKSDRKKIHGLEKKLGYVFWDLEHIKIALSHKSYSNEMNLDQTQHNERLEYLGDAVLDLGISDLLMKHYPNHREGHLSKIRAAIVNETSLSEIARSIGLGDHLFLGRGEEQCDGRNKTSLLADALEAVLGAVYLDAGFDTSFRIIKTLFGELVVLSKTEDINKDYKTKFQEYSQNQHRQAPRYKIVDEDGPDHDKVFTIELTLAGQVISHGQGKSKKQAEQDAAEQALIKVGLHE